MIDFYSDRALKNLIYQGSGIDLSTGSEDSVGVLRKLFKTEIDSLKHTYETFILVLDSEQAIFLITLDFNVSLHKFKKYNAYLIIISGSLDKWKRLIIRNHKNPEIQEILNKLCNLLEEKHTLFKSYRKQKHGNLFKLEKK